MSCLFCRIVAGELPCRKVWENEHVLAFHDIRPAAPVHVLVVPKRHVESVWELDDRALAGELLLAAAEVARVLRLDAGFRLIANTRHDGGQEVGHLHLHVVGGKRLGPMLPR
ncbi:MAG: HIT domain-containing protein [Planctomycetes bacterium]|nr:HIT domain-containing protein [Planctomycetota bacterium]